VQPNQTLALVGGDIGLEGATLKTAGGRIELGSVGDNSLVSLTPINKGFALGYDSVQNFRNIQLFQQTAVDASGAGTGDIQVWGNALTLTNGSQIQASTLGAESGGSLVVNATESIEVIGRSANNQFSSGLFTNANRGATGSAGSLAITTKTLLLQDGAQVTTMTSGAGNGGNLTVNADTVELTGVSGDVQPPSSVLSFFGNSYVAPSGFYVVRSGLSTRSNFGATGNAGDLTINTRELLIRDRAFVRASNQGKGGNLTVNATDRVQLIGASPNGQWGTSFLAISSRNGTEAAGNLTINTRELLIQDGASVGASNSDTGKGGNLIVNATDRMQLSGIGFFSSSLSTNSDFILSKDADAGDIIINTRELLLQDGGRITANTWNGGKGGDLTVNATDRVQLSGIDGRLSSGGLFTNSRSRGDAGNLTINTRELFVRDGAQVGAGTTGTGKAGNLTVNATDRVELSGSGSAGYGSYRRRFFSNLSVQANPEFVPMATAMAGNLTINTRELLIRDGTGVFVGNQGTGNAGNLEVNARSIRLDNQGQINAQSASGNGGNIILRVGDLLLLRRESQISATAGTAQQPGNGGNITINAPDGFIVANRGENSDITANAFSGSGGKVKIQATGIFGIAPLSRQELERLSPNNLDPSKLQTNDITAISQTNPSLSGIVQLITPDVDVNRGLVELPTNLVDISQQIDTGCNPGSKQRRSSFVITGRGGLPPNPSDMLTPDTVLVDLITLNPNSDNRSTPSVTTKPTTNAPERIVEATGWVINEKGEVILTADASTTAPHGSWQNPASCHAS
jgi:large exoprotein involved in heme utilization and adhesion